MLYATVLAFLLSFLDPEAPDEAGQVGEALAAGARAVLPVAATCAAAGIIVAVVTLTGLGLNLSGIIIDVAGGSLFLCALLAAVAVLLLGLAVPVTASLHHRRGDRLAGADEARRRADSAPCRRR